MQRRNGRERGTLTSAPEIPRQEMNLIHSARVHTGSWPNWRKKVKRKKKKEEEEEEKRGRRRRRRSRRRRRRRRGSGEEGGRGEEEGKESFESFVF